jgi:hypothetical protein
MKFFVQASDPQTSCFMSEDDLTLAEAIETIFPLHTDFAILVWNDVYVPLTYKYDISIIINDVLIMLASLIASEKGSTTIHWPSNTFRARWILTWSAAELVIISSWESVIGGTEFLLNKAPVLTIEKKVFLSEWVNLLRKVSNSVLTRSGSIDPTPVLADLDSVLNRIISEGKRGHY